MDLQMRLTRKGALRQALPAEAQRSGAVYPMIKPQANGLVFDLETDPAIFLYLDLAISPE